MASTSSTATTTLIHPERRHVHFQENEITIPSSSSTFNIIDSESDVTDSTWYQFDELDLFRNNARTLCREMRYHEVLVNYADGNNSSSDSEASTSDVKSRRLPSLARNSSTRGLEQRSCEERQRRKYLSSRFILKVAPQLYQTNPEKLAEVSRKCNAWATELAIEEAARDFEWAYATTISICNASRGSSKRSGHESNENGPTKRVRV